MTNRTHPEPAARRRLAFVLGIAALITPAAVAAQQAPRSPAVTSPDGNTRQNLEIAKTESGDNFVLEMVTVPPGGSIAPHSHPVVGHNYILQGEVDSQYDGEEVKHLKAGDTVQDKVGVVHRLWRNTSTTVPLKFLVAFTVKQGQPFLSLK